MIWMLLASLALQDAPPPPQTAPETPEMAEALTNKPLMKVKPAAISRADAGFPEAARAAGEHGEVLVSGIVARDGSFIQTAVTASSRSKLLDEAALAAARAARFSPAKDAAGNPIAVPMTLQFQFDNAISAHIVGYKCDQFVRDQDWWSAHWPTAEHDRMYNATRGLVLLQGPINADTIRSSGRDLDQHWVQAIAACRKQPGALFVDMLKPEGKALRAMAERTR